MQQFDVIVIGGGPAGLSAALWAARYRRRVLLVDAGEQRNRATLRSHGYLGADGISPGDLLTRGRADLVQYDVAVQHSRVTTVRRSGDEFHLLFEDGSPVAGQRLVVEPLGDTVNEPAFFSWEPHQTGAATPSGSRAFPWCDLSRNCLAWFRPARGLACAR